MDEILLDPVTRAIKDLKVEYHCGTVLSVNGGRVTVAGLPSETKVGDRLQINVGGRPVTGEIIGLRGGEADALMDGHIDGISVGSSVRHLPAIRIAPDDSWIGRVIDPDGQPLDGLPLLKGPTSKSIVGQVLPANDRRPLGPRLETGVAAMNTFLPLVEGQRIGLFAGSGVGKSTLLATLAKGVSVDVIVIALVGERGREVAEFTKNTLGSDGMKRAVVVAATSDRSANVRRRCAWTATTIAEYFRDQGKRVLLLFDSITRFCEAHREVAVASGELASLRGFPASTAHLVAELCERAGPGTDEKADITAIYSVLVAGSDMEEPIADMLRGILDGHIVLDRQIAERGRFPAFDILRSVSRSLPQAASDVENQIISKARRYLADYSRSEMMIKAGLYESGTDPHLDQAISCYEQLDRFLEIVDGRTAQAHFSSLKQCLN